MCVFYHHEHIILTIFEDVETRYKLLSFHECLRWKFLIFGITRREWWRLVAIVLDDIFTSVKADLYQSALRTWLTVARWRIFICFPPASLLHYEFTGNQITSQLAVQSSLGVTLQHFSFDRGGLPPPSLPPTVCVFWIGNTVSGIDWHQRKYLENIHFACWKSQYFC